MPTWRLTISVLSGDPSSNAILAKIKDKLPIV